MGNNSKKPKSEKIISLVKNLPYFRVEDLKGLIKNEAYLKIFLSRYQKKGEIFRLKKGLYTTKEFIDNLQKKRELSFYLEFLANLLYPPSYLSLDYILHQYNALTEAPTNFTSITKNKTADFTNQFGNFFYHKIKDKLFSGFRIEKKGDLPVYQATKAKALFDFLYLRKNLIVDKAAAEELRINLDVFDKKDKKELRQYLELEGSEKLKKIFNYLF